MASKARIGIALILIMLVVGVVSVVRKVSATNVDPVLHLRVATMLISPSGQAATAGSEGVWADWRGGTASSTWPPLRCATSTRERTMRDA